MKRAIVILTSLALLAISALGAAAQEPAQCASDYTVQAGDWLSTIAEDLLGDVQAYSAIVEVTNAQTDTGYATIGDPDLIYPGWVLCIPANGETTTMPEASTAPAGLTRADLTNATYQGIYDEPVTLTDGLYEGEPFVEGGASRPTVTFVDMPVTYGDVTGDGQDDAVVLLAENSGGSGVFTYLAAMAVEDGQPVNLATTLLGDRVEINSVTIETNQIVVDMVQAGPDDPACCPTQRVINMYALQEGQLAQISSEEVSGPALAGTVWLWQQTVMNNDETFTPNDPGKYTVQFMEDGSVAIQADCNQVRGSYTLDGSSITIELGPSTLAACPEGSLGDQFLTNLGAAAIYFFREGSLYIDLMADGGTMRFSPQSTDLTGTSWVVIGYNNGRGGVVSPLLETELTATFSEEDGTRIMAGSAGCNNYTTSYEIDGDALTFGPVAATRMACGEPQGIMDQEQEFLAALETVATYQRRGNSLEMRTADGALAVNFQPTP